jgi:hypothetical protein
VKAERDWHTPRLPSLRTADSATLLGTTTGISTSAAVVMRTNETEPMIRFHLDMAVTLDRSKGARGLGQGALSVLVVSSRTALFVGDR